MAACMYIHEPLVRGILRWQSMGEWSRHTTKRDRTGP